MRSPTGSRDLRLPTVNLDASTGFSVVMLSGAAAGFALARFALGIGEAGNFPAAIKTVAEWFPKKERALATGIFNSGTNVGALLTPLAVPWITLRRGAGNGRSSPRASSGFVWVACVAVRFTARRSNTRAFPPAELAYIRSDPPEPTRPIPWARLFPHRQTWAFAIGKFMTDPIWWFYLFWIPDFLNRNHGLDLQVHGPAAGRHLSGGRRRQHRRRLAFLGAASSAAGPSTRRARRPCWFARCPWCRSCSRRRHRTCGWRSALVGLAAAAHQGWSANLFTLTSDMFPRRAVGSVVGIGGMAGAIGGMLRVSSATG